MNVMIYLSILIGTVIILAIARCVRCFASRRSSEPTVTAETCSVATAEPAADCDEPAPQFAATRFSQRAIARRRRRRPTRVRNRMIVVAEAEQPEAEQPEAGLAPPHNEPSPTRSQELLADYIAASAWERAIKHEPIVEPESKKPRGLTSKEIDNMVNAFRGITLSKDAATILAIAGFAGIVGVGIGYLATNHSAIKVNQS